MFPPGVGRGIVGNLGDHSALPAGERVNQLFNESKVIYDLYDGSGEFSRPYREAGYNVVRADIKRGVDVRLLKHFKSEIYGILAGPPCTDLAGSGARWWKNKGEKALLDALSMVDAVYRIVSITDPVFWVLENPVGRLTSYLGPPAYIFDPCDFGDPWTKKTCLWGRFNPPIKNRVSPIEGSKIHLMPPSENRQAMRSVTPPGFSQAFFEANQ